MAHPGVGAFPGAQGLCGPGGRVDHDDDSWPEGRTDPTMRAGLRVRTRVLASARTDTPAGANPWLDPESSPPESSYDTICPGSSFLFTLTMQISCFGRLGLAESGDGLD